MYKLKKPYGINGNSGRSIGGDESTSYVTSMTTATTTTTTTTTTQWRLNSGNILQYYYNNALLNNNLITNNNNNNILTNKTTSAIIPTTEHQQTSQQQISCENITKKSNINIINNIFAISNQELNKNYEKNNIHQYFETINSKLPILSSQRPLGIINGRKSNLLLNKIDEQQSTDSQKRPLLLNYGNNTSSLNTIDQNLEPNFKIIPNKNGLKISPIYTISENLEKYASNKCNKSISSGNHQSSSTSGGTTTTGGGTDCKSGIKHKSAYFRNANKIITF